MKVNAKNILAFIGPIVGQLCIVIALAISPNFDWASNALSDLGSYFRADLGSMQLASAIIFNSGLMVAGFSTAFYSYKFLGIQNKDVSRIPMAIFTLTGILLFSVGVFSEDILIPHAIVAIGFFLTIPTAMITMSLSLMKFHELRGFAMVTLIIAILSFATIFNPWGSIAVREISEALLAIAWLWIVNLLEMKGKFAPIINAN